MAEWFQAGYFTMSLLVKRACDESFQPLGDIMKMWGRVPFSPGPAPPPHMVSTLQLTQNTCWIQKRLLLFVYTTQVLHLVREKL